MCIFKLMHRIKLLPRSELLLLGAPAPFENKCEKTPANITNKNGNSDTCRTHVLKCACTILHFPRCHSHIWIGEQTKKTLQIPALWSGMRQFDKKAVVTLLASLKLLSLRLFFNRPCALSFMYVAFQVQFQWVEFFLHQETTSDDSSISTFLGQTKQLWSSSHNKCAQAEKCTEEKSAWSVRLTACSKKSNRRFSYSTITQW